MPMTAAEIVASVQANPPGGDVAVSPAVRVLVEEIVRLRGEIKRLADLYRRRDGTMRACNYYSDGRCLRTGCYRDGCDRANEILKATGS